ncbi:E3 ubiquitin-protein ligase RNF10 [Danaus plexippus]|uniref:E3 ubiquitin-protein ligase RNF10 n=1 Tax=Danaus plexippus TaxID=13037 RepID=UPI0013C4136F|nr:E3 ubiquitin-protein ligase RNF10 [Danaus plexippus]
MLEETRMDKKSSNRTTLQQSRASAIDCKKNTELTHKPWPRNNKKREGPGATLKNDPYRKNVQSQRGRGQMDKRPCARGTTNFIVGGTQNTRLEDEEGPEIGSVFIPGSKKQNLNHLLNFKYPSRSGTDIRSVAPRRQAQHVSYRHEHDLYLRAYCQFVVKEDGDYKVNLMDPDLPLKWEQIEEIIVRSTGKLECPICLGTPVAGRVGHCGHVYCWACILHYSSTHDKQPPPCPVCAMGLQVSEMKPTHMVQWEQPAEEVNMRLVRRLRGSTVVEASPPRGQMKETSETHILPLKDLPNYPFAKLFSASKREVLDILERDRKQIEMQILAEIDTTEIIYLEQALEMLKLKEKNISLQYEEHKDDNRNAAQSSAPVVYEKQTVNETKLDWFDVTDEGATCLTPIQDNMANLDINVKSELDPEAEIFTLDVNENADTDFANTEYMTDDQYINNDLKSFDKENQAKYFYFYQAEDGQQVFLNSLNVRILNASWGVLAAAPNVIRGRVLHRETLPLCEQTRKHMPHTAHLPLHCSFDIVELDLKPPFVTQEALYNFSVELEKRARQRAKNQRDERRRERAYRRAMEGPPKPDFSSEVVFPPAAASYYGSPPQNEFLNYDQISPPSTSQNDQASPTTHLTSPSGLSFAKMAGAGGTWRVRKTTPPTPTTPPPEECSGPRTLVLSDAIEAALLATSPQTSGKKKKTKQKVLFTTGMHRAA